MAAKFENTKGFTLIESIIAIVILGIAMLTLTSFLFPQIEQSARPSYEVRASALANSFMTEVLARGFDEYSDPDGGWVRCSENSEADPCSDDLGPEESDPGYYNDVDDYIGCWYTNEPSKAACDNTLTQFELSDIFGKNITEKYPNFTVNVYVDYEPKPKMKRVTIVVTGGQYATLTLVAHRGNY